MHGFGRKDLLGKIFGISSEQDFEEAALELFSYQLQRNRIYKSYIELLGTDTKKVKRVADIPCLPAAFFKSHKILSVSGTPKLVFRSSGTEGTARACHYVADPGVYRKSFMNCFRIFYGDPADFCILALLPSYLEKGESSLVFMVSELIKESRNPESGFYLNDPDRLAATMDHLESQKKKVFLIGVSFALLDLAEKQNLSLKNTIVMETGGMKGRRKELVREELHRLLEEGMGVKEVHSEYGMTELLSQAYSRSSGQFRTPPWMRVMIRDTYDPFTYLDSGRNGGVNIIDLANIDSCAFLETADLGKALPDGSFEILGRFDNSDIRGCNLLAE